MAEVVLMPKMSDTMEEGVVVAWHKKVGDKVKNGDLLAEVQTDKATMDFISDFDGFLLYASVETGGNVPVGKLLAIIGKEGEDITKLLESNSNSGPIEKNTTTNNVIVSNAFETNQPLTAQSAKQVEQQEDRLKISPLAKNLAKEHGVELQNVKGTGESGRIIKRDIESALDTKAVEAILPMKVATPIGIGESYYDEPISQMRKTIAKRLGESKFSAPHFYLTVSIQMDNAIDFRQKLNELSDTKISFNDIIVKSVAHSLKKHPNVNVSWLGDKIRHYEHIHIGVAVAVEEGLVVPIIRFADTKGLAHIAKETKQLAEKAKTKGLQPSDYQGNTFTISNLGMFGIEEFTAIINPPDACILAIGNITKQVIIDSKDEMVKANMMKITLSCDHRVVDGAVGSAFLKTLKHVLENPMNLLL